MPPASQQLHDNLMLMLGQVIESSKAASEGLKTLGGEVQANAKSILSVMHGLSTLQENVAQLERIIRHAENPANLVGAVGVHGADLVTVKLAVAELHKVIDNISAAVKRMDSVHDKASGAGTTLWWVGLGAAWATTTGIALYAALK